MCTQPEDHMSKSKALETALNNKLLGSHEHLKKGPFSPTAVVADFFFTFQGIEGCSADTTAAATMIHAAAASQGPNPQVRQSLIAGIGLTSGEKEAISSSSAATGKLPARQLLYANLRT